MDKLICLSIVNNHLENYEFLNNMPGLMKVNLKGNELSSLDIHTAYKFLECLDLSDNNIDKTSIVYDLPSLKSLHLGNNEFGRFPGIFKHMPNLEILDISNNKLIELPGMKLPYLKELNLAGNRLTHLTGIRLNESLKKLNIGNNMTSDFSPLLCNDFYKNLNRLDIAGNPVSEESYFEVIPKLNGEIDNFSEPEDYEPRSPCYPGPGSPAKVSNKEIILSWQSGEDAGNAKYNLYIGSGDSIKLVYDNLINPFVKLRLSEGQKYIWQVGAVSADTVFYSGLYELSTTTELELPYREDFELFSIGAGITAASTNWRLTHGINDSYQDAEISNAKDEPGHGKSLHISDYSNVSIDLDHLRAISTLIIHYDQFIMAGKTAHISFENIQGLNIDIYSDGYRSQIFIDGSYLSAFNTNINSWNSFRVSIQGQNNRIFISCNGDLILNQQWLFTDSKARLGGMVFSPDSPEGDSPFGNYESFIDNLLIYDANDRTGVEDINTNEDEILIYPNPASQRINITGLPVSGKDLNIEILDSRGREIRKETLLCGITEVALNVTGLAPGIYYWKISGPDKTLGSGKLLIAR
jgi:hypothetical protein